MVRRVSLFAKLLAAFLLLSLPPLVWLSIDAALRIGEVGHEAVVQATRTLNAKASQALELQAANLAADIESFLEQRLQDLEILASLPPDPKTLSAFARERTGSLWVRTRAPDGAIVGHTVRRPLYAEVAWIGPDGRERLRFDHGVEAAPRALRDVSTPAGTAYGVEDYFRRARELPPGEAYVGRLTGYHVGMAEQLGDAATIEEAVEGKEYRGHIRFARAVWKNGVFLGVLALALDHRHLMEFTQHVLPLSVEPVLFPTYQSGDYAFLFDDEGWIITHPKYWDIRGLDKDGREVPPYRRDSSEADIKAGRIPFNLDHAGFVDPNYPLAAAQVRLGRSGVTRTSNVAGVDKVMAYAPIHFRKGVYAASGVFGGVTIGWKTEGFHEEAKATGASIDRAAQLTLRTGFFLAWCFGLVVLFAALVLSRTISRPIGVMAIMARKISAGNLSARVDAKPGDEVGDLAAEFNRMASLLEEKDKSLRGSLRDLQLSRDDANAYAQRLEEQLRLLGQIQAISEFLGTTFDREPVLDILLKNTVEELGFDRAAIYLIEPGERRLARLAHAGYGPEGPPPDALPLDGYSPLAEAVREGKPLHGPLPDTPGHYACAPMVIRDAVVGALWADTARRGQPIPEHMAWALQIVGGQAARAIERARLFEAARREHDFVEAVVASVATGLLTLDDQGRILSANPYARRALALGDAFKGRALAQCGLPRPLTDWVEALGRGAPPDPAEFALPLAGAEALFVWVPSRFATEAGQGLILQFRDVTAERALNRELERVDRLASLGRLAAGVAHEIRNPLTGVSLLLDDLHDRLGDEADRALAARALNEIERLEGLVQSMLDYAKAGTMRKRPVSLAEVLEETLFLVKRTARGQGVELETDLGADLPTVLADPDKLKQAFLNFCLNSMKAMPQGGLLTVRAEAVAEGALVTLRDTGTGIPKAELERIFEPFYTLSPGGSGLGLSIAHTIVTEHGGRIEIDSTVGHGTQLKVFLPAASS